MIKNIFLVEDLLEMVNGLFNQIEETIEIDKEVVLLKDYLNFSLYSIKNRLMVNEDYLNSLQKTLNTIYGLVFIDDSKKIFSSDIKYSSIDGNIKFICESSKISSLEYFLELLREFVNGNEIKINEKTGFLKVNYPTIEATETTSFGECSIVTLEMNLILMDNTNTYESYDIKLSVDDTNYYSVPLSQMTIDCSVLSTSNNKINYMDVGFINTSQLINMSISFYDFNATLTNIFRNISLSTGAYSKDGSTGYTKPGLNDIVYMTITINSIVYKYKLIRDKIKMIIANGTYVVFSLNLKTYGG